MQRAFLLLFLLPSIAFSQVFKQNESKKKWWHRKAINILKVVLRELKLPKEHPKVLERLKQRLNEHEKCSGKYFIMRLKAEEIIKLY